MITQKHRIKFDSIGNLPVPEGHQPLRIVVAHYHPFSKCRWYGTHRVQDEDNPDQKLRYSFTPLGDKWKNFISWGYEDCEVGRCTIQAESPNGETYRWEIFISHDGDPKHEFWGFTVENFEQLHKVN